MSGEAPQISTGMQGSEVPEPRVTTGIQELDDLGLDIALRMQYGRRKPKLTADDVSAMVVHKMQTQVPSLSGRWWRDMAERVVRGVGDVSVSTIDNVTLGYDALWQTGKMLYEEARFGASRPTPAKGWVERATGAEHPDMLDLAHTMGAISDPEEIRTRHREELGNWEPAAAIAGELIGMAAPGPSALVGRGASSMAIGMSKPVQRLAYRMIDKGAMTADEVARFTRQGRLLTELAKRDGWGRVSSIGARLGDAAPGLVGEAAALTAQTGAASRDGDIGDVMMHSAVMSPVFLGLSRGSRWLGTKMMDRTLSDEAKEAYQAVFDAMENGAKNKSSLWKMWGKLPTADRLRVLGAEGGASVAEGFGFALSTPEGLKDLMDAYAGQPGAMQRLFSQWAGGAAGIAATRLGVPLQELPFVNRLRPELNSYRAAIEAKRQAEADKALFEQRLVERAEDALAQGEAEKAVERRAQQQVQSAEQQSMQAEQRAQQDIAMGAMVDPLRRSGFEIRALDTDTPSPVVRMSNPAGEMSVGVRGGTPVVSVSKEIWERVRPGEAYESEVAGADALRLLTDVSLHSAVQQTRSMLRMSRAGLEEPIAGAGWRDPETGRVMMFGADGKLYGRDDITQPWKEVPDTDTLRMLIERPIGGKDTPTHTPGIDRWAHYLSERARDRSSPEFDEAMAIALNAAQYGSPRAESANELRRFFDSVSPDQFDAVVGAGNEKVAAQIVASIGAGLGNTQSAVALLRRTGARLLGEPGAMTDMAGREFEARWRSEEGDTGPGVGEGRVPQPIPERPDPLRAERNARLVENDATRRALEAEQLAREAAASESGFEPVQEPVAAFDANRINQLRRQQEPPKYERDNYQRERMFEDIGLLFRNDVGKLEPTKTQADLIRELMADAPAEVRKWWDNWLGRVEGGGDPTIRGREMKQLAKMLSQFADKVRSGGGGKENQWKVQSMDSLLKKAMSTFPESAIRGDVSEAYSGIPLRKLLSDIAKIGKTVFGESKERTAGAAAGRSARGLVSSLITDKSAEVGRYGEAGQRLEQAALRGQSAFRRWTGQIRSQLADAYRKMSGRGRYRDAVKWLEKTAREEDGVRLSRMDLLLSGESTGEPVPQRVQELLDAHHDLRMKTGEFAVEAGTMRAKRSKNAEGEEVIEQVPFEVRRDIRIDPRSDITEELARAYQYPDDPHSREILEGIARANAMDVDKLIAMVRTDRVRAESGPGLDRRSSTEFFRELKVLPSQVKVGGKWVDLRATKLLDRTSRMVDSEITGSSARMAFGQEGIPEAVRKERGLLPGARKFVEDVRSGAGVEAERAERVATELVQQIEGKDPSVLDTLVPSRRIRRAVAEVEGFARAGLASASATFDIPSPLGSSHMGGLLRTLKGIVKLPFVAREAWRDAHQTGALLSGHDIYGMAGGRRGILRMLRTGIGGLTMLSGRYQELVSHVIADQMVKDLAAGKGRGELMRQRLADLRFRPDEIAMMQSGNVGQLGDELKRRFVRGATGAKTKSESSMAGGARAFKAAFPFSSWALSRAQRVASVHAQAVRAFASKQPGKIAAAATRLAEFYLGSASAGMIGVWLSKFIASGFDSKEAFDEMLREFEEGGWAYIAKVTGATMVGGPLAAIGAAALNTRDQSAAERLVNMTSRGRVADVMRAASGEGTYRDLDTGDRAIALARRYYPLARTWATVGGLVGISEGTDVQDALSDFYAWRRDRGLPPPSGDSRADEDVPFGIATRKIRDFVRAHGSMDPQAIVNLPEFEPMVREAFSVAEGDDIYRSLLSRRVLDGMTVEQLEDLRKYRGDETVRALNQLDVSLGMIAEAFRGKSGTPRHARSELVDRLSMAETQLRLGNPGTIWRPIHRDVMDRAVAGVMAGQVDLREIMEMSRSMALYPESLADILGDDSPVTLALPRLNYADASMLLYTWFSRSAISTARRRAREELRAQAIESVNR